MQNEVLTCASVSVVVLPRLPGKSDGAGPVRPAGVSSESSSGGSAVPALSPPAGLPAVQQPALPAPPLKVQGGVQVRAAALFSSIFSKSVMFGCVNRRLFLPSRYFVKPSCAEEKLPPHYPISQPTVRLVEELLNRNR